MKMPGQDKVIATLSRSLPDARVVCAEDSDIAIGRSCGGRTGDRNHPKTVLHSGGAIMNPFTSTSHNCLTDSIHTDMFVVVSTNSEDRSEFA